ncbi:zinc finger protein 862-like [Rhizophagus clarus]|nr:zinc finger protein 862-like [Rhizophagus clarus]
MANFLHQALTTEFYITKFLADILATMKSMILVFQSDYVSLTETCKQLSMAIETITSDFIGSENSAPHYGIHLANYMNEYSLTGENLPITIKQFAQATIKSLRNRFPDSTLYYSIKILDPNEAPNNHDGLDTYGESEIKSLAEFYGKAKKNGSKIMCEPVLDGNTLIREWRMVRNIIYDYKNFWFIEAWYHIFNNNISFRDQFPNLTKLVELVLVVPVSNGVVERVFSHQNLIKTKLRNKMSIQTLNLHLHFSLNGPKDFSNYDYEKAYVYWNGVPRFNNQ